MLLSRDRHRSSPNSRTVESAFYNARLPPNPWSASNKLNGFHHRISDSLSMDLGVNQALLTVRSRLGVPVAVLWQSTECYKCDPRVLMELSPEFPNVSKIVSTFYPSLTTLQVGPDKHVPSNCSIPSFENQGVYGIEIENEHTCTVSIETQPTSIYHPLIAAVLIQLFVDFFRRLLIVVLEKRRLRNSHTSSGENETSSQGPLEASSNTVDTQMPGQKTETARKPRVKSLDTFRGFCLFLMIFVNYGGGKLWIFEHSPWNGLTFADLLFPWFVWIMGVSLAISLRSMRRKCVPLSEVFLKIVSRSVKLFILGLILNSMDKNNDISKLRIPGVLQRFAVSYFTVASMHMFFSRATDAAEAAKWAKIRDIVLYWQEWLLMIMLVICHTLLTFCLRVADCPTGYLGPGGFQENGTYFNCTGGAAGYIDRVLLGPNHIYAHPTTEEVYETAIPYDPEGVLGCLTSIFLTFLGLQAGKILLTFKTSSHRISRWLCWGTLLGLSAGILCCFRKEDGWIPINKNLWSLSFVLCTAGLANILLSIFYLLIDVFGAWSGTPFIYPGMNSILVYVGHALVTGMLPWFWAGPETHWRYMAMNLGGVYFWVLISYALHRERFYLAL